MQDGLWSALAAEDGPNSEDEESLDEFRLTLSCFMSPERSQADVAAYSPHYLRRLRSHLRMMRDFEKLRQSHLRHRTRLLRSRVHALARNVATELPGPASFPVMALSYTETMQVETRPPPMQ